MPRTPRISWAGGLFHVLNRGVDHQRIFFGDADRVDFGRCLAEIHERHRVETVAYCLMTNHYHLIVRTPDDTLSAAMHHLGGTFTRRTNDRVGRDGPLFRGRFVSIPVLTDSYLQWLARYVHRNPLDIEGVADPRRYRWSSLRTYLGDRPTPKFLNTALVLGAWADIDAFRRFHVGSTPNRLQISTPGELDALIAHAIVAADQPDEGASTTASPDRLLRTQALARTIRVLVGADGPRPVAALVSASFPTDGARRSALSRARTRARRDERVGRAVAWVLDAIAA